MATSLPRTDSISVETTRLLISTNKINIYSVIASCIDELRLSIQKEEDNDHEVVQKLHILTDFVKIAFVNSSNVAVVKSSCAGMGIPSEKATKLADSITHDICILLLERNVDADERNHLCLKLIRVLSALMEDVSFTAIFTKLLNLMTINLCDDDEAVGLNSKPLSIAVLLGDLLSKDSHLAAGKCKSTINKWRVMLIEHCLPVLSQAGDRLAGRIATSTMPRVLRSMETQEQTTAIGHIWEMICELFDRCKITSELSSDRPHMLLCAFADFLLPVHDVSDLRQESSSMCDACKQFLMDSRCWRMLQCGLHNASTACRKQSTYMLKRILDVVQVNAFNLEADDESSIFWWDSESSAQLSDVWREFILLMETLEETQIHIIKPLMPRLQTLVSATATRSKGLPALLHTSWLMSVFQRISKHESTLVKRWGVLQLLTVDYITCPVFQQHQQQFFYGSFVTMLTDSAIYHKPPDIPLGTCTPIGVGLQSFFRRLPEILKHSEIAEFCNKFMRALAAQSWNGAALVFVVLGMCELPVMAIWEHHVLPDFMDVLAVGLRSVDCHIRGAIQCCLLKLFTRLVNADSVEPKHLALILGVVRSDECLCRGTSLWSELMEWMRQVAAASPLWHRDKLREYINVLIQALLKVPTGDEPKEIPHQSLLSAVRFILLVCDAGLLPRLPSDACHRDDTLQAMLWPLMDVLHRGSTHVYMSTVKVDRVLEFVITLVQQARLCKGIKIPDGQLMFDKLVRDCSSSAELYISRQLPELTNLSDVNKVQLYQAALETLLADVTCTSDGVSQLVTVSIENLRSIQASVSSMQNQMLRFACMSILASISSTSAARTTKPQHPHRWQHQLSAYLHQMPVMTSFQKPAAVESAQPGMWGRLASGFLAAQWTCLSWLLDMETAAISSQYELYTSHCIEVMPLVTEHTLLPVFRCFHSLMPHLSADSVLAVISVGWNKTKEEMKTRCFWQTYELFIQLAFHSNNIRQTSPVPVGTMLAQIGSEILQLGNERAGLANTLVRHLAPFWSENDFCHLLIPLLVLSLLFGDAQKKCIRFVSEVQLYLHSFGDKLAANELVDIHLRSDTAVRVSALTVLAKLQRTLPEHCQLAQTTAAQLMEQQRQLVGSKRYHTFANCSTHRRKMRAFAALLVLLPFLTDKSDLWDFLMDMLLVETLPSVRCLIEWIIVRLLHQSPERATDIWKNLDQNSRYRGAALCSLMMIVWQTSKLVDIHDDKALFMQNALRHILPWCIEHHFNTKVFALAVLTMLWQQCKLDKLEAVTTAYRTVELLTHAENSYGHKSVEKLLENFFFKFHPIRDFSVETITDTLPRLTGVADDECLPPQLFLHVDATWKQAEKHSLLLFNESDDLKHCTPGSWRVKVTDVDEDNQEGNVQKKMVPWQAMFPVISQSEDVCERKRQGGLILVTSLINKIPNLGGLCRTCEIFGVSEFIVGAMKHVEDKGFQNMSVTADTWIPIREVKPRLLAHYLAEMKEEGYTLVGAEQTAHSKCLTDFHFPTKTLLLLGNEKQGIPMGLLQLMDVCVEIPQQGVVRSLNVHVSGALFIWEYTRQQLAASS